MQEIFCLLSPRANLHICKGLQKNAAENSNSRIQVSTYRRQGMTPVCGCNPVPKLCKRLQSPLVRNHAALLTTTHEPDPAESTHGLPRSALFDSSCTEKSGCKSPGHTHYDQNASFCRERYRALLLTKAFCNLEPKRSQTYVQLDRFHNSR
jgi:hypothetical protein